MRRLAWTCCRPRPVKQGSKLRELPALHLVSDVQDVNPARGDHEVGDEVAAALARTMTIRSSRVAAPSLTAELGGVDPVSHRGA